MKARDLAKVLRYHPDAEVAVRITPIEGVSRTLYVHSAGRAPLTGRIMLEVKDPGGQLEIEPATPGGTR